MTTTRPASMVAKQKRRARTAVVVFLGLGMIAAACNPAAPASDDENSSEYLFAQDQLHTFDLDLDEADLAFLDGDPKAEEYVGGTLTFNGETIPVGIRYKGSVGAFLGCVENATLSNPGGRGAKTCPKLSLKVKINWEEKVEFYGQRKLQFHSMNLDDSQMRDRLGYAMFREMGVPAPRSTHARVMMNGEYVGLFAMVEQIDGRFTRRNWDSGKGNLYKEVWPLDDDGEATSNFALINSLETNEDDGDVAVMSQFGRDLAAASPEDAPAVVERFTDLDETLRYMAVDRMIAHDDGPTHWRCIGAFCYNHNYYWYVDPATDKAHLIAWDLDNAFVSILDPNPFISIRDAWGETSNDCEPLSSGGFTAQRSAACDPLFEALAQYPDRYDALVEEFIAGPFSVENVNALLDQWSDQIRDATAEAHELHGGVSVEEWELQVERLRQSVAQATSDWRATHPGGPTTTIPTTTIPTTTPPTTTAPGPCQGVEPISIDLDVDAGWEPQLRAHSGMFLHTVNVNLRREIPAGSYEVRVAVDDPRPEPFDTPEEQVRVIVDGSASQFTPDLPSGVNELPLTSVGVVEVAKAVSAITIQHVGDPEGVTTGTDSLRVTDLEFVCTT